jgi:hypothetical protein
VPGLLTCDEGKAVEVIVAALESAGYIVTHEVVNSQLLVPQVPPPPPPAPPPPLPQIRVSYTALTKHCRHNTTTTITCGNRTISTLRSRQKFPENLVIGTQESVFGRLSERLDRSCHYLPLSLRA